jgi:hypothetical protein
MKTCRKDPSPFAPQVGEPLRQAAYRLEGTPQGGAEATVYVGIITSEPRTTRPLLEDLGSLEVAGVRLVAVVLDNASREAEMAELVARPRPTGFELIVVGTEQQSSDAARGVFGKALRERLPGRVSIAAARTMLQRYLAAWMAADPDAFAWLLDDDMRVDGRALRYLPQLARFREAGVDVLIGALEGASPNPPLHGIQGQLFDLVHNLSWLKSLPDSAVLPDRSLENAAHRAKYPDYYYDLSRKHSGHLLTPFWVEPSFPAQTVAAARARLIETAAHIPWGAPLTRRLVGVVPSDPIDAAKDSVNRGGNTFVLNRRALSSTPNPSLRAGQQDMRRSDMFWAIVNRHYRRLTIKQVGFPVEHVVRRRDSEALDTAKVAAELVGASLYAALTGFLQDRPEHELQFSANEVAEIGRQAEHHRERRLAALANSFARIASLRAELHALAPGELDGLDTVLADWITPRVLEEIGRRARAVDGVVLQSFVSSLRGEADALDAAPLAEVKRLRPCGRGGT